MNEKIGSLLTFCEPLPSRISSGIVRTCANTCLREGRETGSMNNDNLRLMRRADLSRRFVHEPPLSSKIDRVLLCSRFSKEGIGSIEARDFGRRRSKANSYLYTGEEVKSVPRYLILTSDDRSRRHVLLQLNRESASDGLHDTRGAALLAEFRVPVVVMGVPHVLRGNFIFEKGPFGHEHPG